MKQQGVDDEEHVAQVRKDGGVQLLLIFKLIPPSFNLFFPYVFLVT